MEQAILSGEQAKHDLTINQLNTGLRQSEFDLAKIKLRQRVIKSPINGQVSEVFVQKGEWIDLGKPVARIVNLSPLRAVALVTESHLLAIKRGQPARLHLAMGAERDSKFSAKGKVSYVSPEVNPVNREFWVDISNAERKLRPGLVGTLYLEKEE